MTAEWDKNLKTAVKVVKVLSDLISKAIHSGLDISSADFKKAMDEYEVAKEKLAELDRGDGNGEGED